MTDLVQAADQDGRRDLALIPPASLPTIIAADKDDILGKLAAELADFEADVSTDAGRKEIASKAYKVARAKQDLIRLAASLKEDAQKTIKGINSEVKIIEERMDTLRDQVRQPLNEFEAREKARISGHESALVVVESWAAVPPEWTSEQISGRMAEIGASDLLKRDWQEYTTKAQKASTAAFNALRVAQLDAERREAAAAEAARLQAEEAERARQEAERQRQEREARIAAEAAERARQEAEQRAAREAEEAARKAQEERERIEAQARAEAEAAARREREAREAAERAEQERLAAEQRAREAEQRAVVERQAAAERAEQERLAAERRVREAEERAAAERKAAAERAELERIAAAEREERARQEARAAEQQRIAAEEQRRKREAEERERNVAHRRAINREAAAAIVEAFRDVHSGNAAEANALAKAIVTAIAKGAVPHVTISY